MKWTTGAQRRYLLQAERQRASALDFIHLPGAAQRLLDHVPETVVVLQQRQEQPLVDCKLCSGVVVTSLFFIPDSGLAALQHSFKREREREEKKKLSPLFTAS